MEEGNKSHLFPTPVRNFCQSPKLSYEMDETHVKYDHNKCYSVISEVPEFCYIASEPLGKLIQSSSGKLYELTG